MKKTWHLLLVLCTILLISPIYAQNNCDQTLKNAKKFKSIAFNKHNGGFTLIGEDDYLYDLPIHMQKLSRLSTYKNSKVTNLTDFNSETFTMSMEGYGMMKGAQSPNNMAPIASAGGMWVNVPSTAKYVFGDRQRNQIWYINESNFIRPISNPNNAIPVPPDQAVQQFTVYDGKFFALDLNNNVLHWSVGMANWQKFRDIKARFITNDRGLSTPL